MELTHWLPTIVVANAVITFMLWRTVAALTRTAARKPPQPKKAFLKNLQGGPIQPKPVRQKPAPQYVEDGTKQFGRDFADFGAVVNWWLADQHVGSSWRLQELEDTNLQLGAFDCPIFGRCFDIFYNQVRFGRLEVNDMYGYSKSEPKVRTRIALNNVRLLSFDEVHTFLLHVALHVTDPDRSAVEYVRTRQEIEGALTRAVWDTLHIGDFELTLEGTARWYFGRRDCEGFRQLKKAA